VYGIRDTVEARQEDQRTTKLSENSPKRGFPKRQGIWLYIQRIEGKNPPAIKIDTIERLAKALKV